MRAASLVVPGLVLLVPLAGCVTQGGSEDGGAAQPSPSSSGPPSATTAVDLAWSTDSGTDEPSYVAYEATVELGEPVSEAGECELAPPDGTGTVPVTVTLVNTDDESREDVIHRSAPAHLAAEPLGGAGPLRWVTTRPGAGGCTDEPDIDQAFSGGWEHRETRELRGELVGVPLDDPSGHGLEVEFAAPDWTIESGHAEPLPVRF